MTSAEKYIAQKLCSKLSRALRQLSEAKQAAQALPGDMLEQLGGANALKAISTAMTASGDLRDRIRGHVPAHPQTQQWEERSG